MVNDETFATLQSDKEQTRLLIADIRDALDNPEYNQAIHEAVIRSGVPQRLGVLSDAAAAAAAAALGRQGDMRGRSTSPRSTITLNTGLEADQQFGTPRSVTAPGAIKMQRSNRSEGDTELKQQVESLLQRTDSILSRSSGHSASIHKSLAEAPLQRRRTTANYFSPGGASRQQQPRHASAVQDSLASTPGTRSPHIGGGAFSPDSDSAPPMGEAPAAGIGGWSNLSPSSAGDAVGVGAVGLRSHARRLSQQAQSEAGDRFDSRGTNALTDRGELEQQRRVFDSGVSADRTTLVLGRSASWNVAAGRTAGEGPYANFGPLADLVDSVVADAGGAAAGTTAAAAEGAAGGLLTAGPARTSAAATDDSGSSKGHVPHKVALGYMLLPEYVQTAALNRLKASLTSMSTAQPQLLPATPGGTQFELLLLALTARLSQWPQLERQAEQVFQQMLYTMLDNIFARLSTSRGGAPPPGRERGAVLGTTAIPQAPISSNAAVLGSVAAATAASSRPGHGLAEAVARSSTTSPERQSAHSFPARRASDAGPGVGSAVTTAAAAAAAAAEPAAVPVKLSESMVRAAFAKLALGQAMLRGMPGKNAKPSQQQQLEQEQQHKPRTAFSNEQQLAAATGPPAAADGDGAKPAAAESAAGTPDVGLTPALSRAASSTCSSQCLTFNKVASKHDQGTPCQLQHAQERQPLQRQQQPAERVQWQQALQAPAVRVAGQAVYNSSSSRSPMNCRNRTTLDRLTAAVGQLGSTCSLHWPQQQLQQQQQLASMVQCQQKWHAPVDIQGSCSGSSPLLMQPGTRLAAATSSRSPLPASWVSDAANSPTWQQQQQQQQQLSQQGQQLWSGESTVQHQQQHYVAEGGSWLLPEQPQQPMQEGRQQLAQCAGLGAWLPSVGSISPGKAAVPSRSSCATLTQASCSNRHQQQQQSNTLWMHSPSRLGSRQVHAANCASEQQSPWLADQQQQQKLFQADQAQQLLQHVQQRPRKSSVLPHRVSSVPDLQRLSTMQQQQQQLPCSHGGSPSTATHTARCASSARRATISKTLADMQQQHDQEQQRQQHQQQQMPVQPWLQSKQARQQWRQGCEGSPGRVSSSPGNWQAGNGSSTYLAATGFREEWQQLAAGRACLKQPAMQQGVSSTAVRVSTAGAQAVLSPPKGHGMSMLLNGGCVEVYTDGVEVHSINPLVISVCSSPTQPPAAGASVTVAETERSLAAQLSSGWSPARVVCGAAPGTQRSAAKRLSL